jgi:hypothetical protein
MDIDHLETLPHLFNAETGLFYRDSAGCPKKSFMCVPLQTLPDLRLIYCCHPKFSQVLAGGALGHYYNQWQHQQQGWQRQAIPND